MNAPVRIQLRRTKGWRMPANTVVVSRPSRFGNPWRVVNERKWGNGWVVLDPSWVAEPKRHCMADRTGALLLALQQHEVWMRSGFGPDLSSLRGKSLACWCPLPAAGEPDCCHAAVLLELAAR